MTLPNALSFDLSDWTQIDFTGADCRSFLHNFCTNDINRLAPGQCCEAFVCDIKGRVLGHILVLADNQSLRLISVPGQADKLIPHFTKYLLGADVSIDNRSEEEGLLCLCGNQVGSFLQSLSGQDISLQPGEWKLIHDGPATFRIAGTNIVGLPAVLISGRRSDLEDFRERVPDQVVAIGTQELFESLRIQAGFPYVGTDIGPENIAQEVARNQQAISFTKGCYLGQEPIARLDAMGHTNKELRRFVIEGNGVAPGQAIIVDGAPVGTISSVAAALESEQQVALGIIKVRHADTGTSVHIQTPQGEVSATVM